MASTRDKRMKTDSPTPAQPAESTTPTTKSSSAIKLKRMSRNRSGLLSSGKLENEDENDSVGLSEDTVSSTASANDNKTANTRAKRQLAKEEKETEESKVEEDGKDGKTSESPAKRVTKSQVLKPKAASLTTAMARRSAMLKRSSLPLPAKTSLRNFTRRSSVAKTTDASKGKDVVTPKKGKATRKATEKKENEEDEEPTTVDPDHEDTESSVIEIKQEKIDPKANDTQNIRRSTRQRKSTIKDRDSPFTRRSMARDKSESKRDSTSPALIIKTEKDSAKAITLLVDTNETTVEKDPSLSPELVSEELDTESVQHLYDKPDFLENNLGIEKDPKLGEIVKVQEKTKTIVETALITVVMKKEEKDKDDEDEKKRINEKTQVVIEEKIVDRKKEEKMEVEEKIESESETEDKKEELSGDAEGEKANESNEKSKEIAEKSEMKVEKPEEMAEKSDKVDKADEKSEKMAEKSDKIVEKSENNAEKSEKVAEKSEKIAEKSENIAEKSDENADKSEKNSDKIPDKTEIIEKSEKKQEKPEKVPEKLEKKQEKPETVQEKPEKKAEKKTEKPKEAPEKSLKTELEPKPETESKTEAIDEKPKEQEKVEQMNGEKMEVDEPQQTKQTEIAESNKKEAKIDTNKNEEIKQELVNDIKDEKPEKIQESLEENKENNVESSAKSIGSNSPRSEDRLKIMSETNTPKIELTESAELLKIKENHFKSLGLFTHKAAEEAKIAKQKRKEELALQAAQQASRKAKKESNDNHSSSSKTTGTLKTIIKLNRSEKEKRKTRMPLKITFQKKNRDKDANGSSNSSENSFYTIQNEKDLSSSENHGAISRKSLNRSYNHEQVASSNDQYKNHEPVVNKELDQSLVIPEKASSFKVHPERICKDQCFYCGGKFGLYDTPCHIAQIKSTERQNKILESEEKLTKDSCLCDACFRHVDRRANCPSYRNKQRPSGPSQPSTSSSTSPVHNSQHSQNNYDRTFGICNVIDCNENAVHSIRKKWVVKMKRTISKIFQINLDLQPTNTNVSICEEHFAALSHIMVCAMCKRKLPRNHIFYINQDISRLEHLISEQGLHIKLSNSTLVVCKLCSYYNNLLFKPPEPKTQKADFVKNYTKKLMKHNSAENEYANRHIVQIDDDDVQEVPIRNDDLTLTIKNGRIQPKKLPDRFQNNKEVTITMKGSPAPSGHMLLDNDVMVGYDVPMLENCPSPPAHTIRNPNYKGPITTAPQVTTQKTQHKTDESASKKKKDDNSEMARALKSNPNISMRELFPGEEEMALNINMPFSSGAQRTPEGWFKVQMTIQYDEVTKALWEHLQRPYGNQSSFIRHLVLLEKYYRNGDLILSQSASSSASSYSESVRNRLRSYDNIPSTLSTTGAANLSNEVTIIPASKAKKLNESLTITPQPGNSLLKRKSSQNDVGSPKPKVVKIDDTPKKTSPPELISFNNPKPASKGSAKDTNKAPTVALTSTNTTNVAPVVMAPVPTNTSIANNTNSVAAQQTATTTAAAAAPATTTTNPNTTTSQSGSSNNSSNGNVIVLPDTLTPQERKQCSKSWRPTLIPITGSGQLLNSNGPLYQTADGRKLPELVQVMSGGKPYHISIHDYNKMCIIRREKLQQQLNQKARQQALTQTQNTAGGSSPNSSATQQNNSTHTSLNTHIPASTTALSIIPMPKEKEPTANNFKPPTTSTPSNPAKKIANIPNQLLEQNSLIPINTIEQNGKKHHNGAHPPPLTTTFPKTTTTANMMSMLPPALSALSKTVNALQPTSSATAQLAAWNALWNDNEISINSDNMAALAQIANLANLGTNMIDTSAASLLSKIPKSLTVIPQAKSDRRSSDEHKHNSAST